MNKSDDAVDLKAGIESQYGGTATLAHEMPIVEVWEGQTVWEGVVSVFDLIGHPQAKRAYAWSEPVPDSKRREFFAVLELPPVDSALSAVKASIVHRNRR